jgi:hypothetical protein
MLGVAQTMDEMQHKAATPISLTSFELAHI